MLLKKFDSKLTNKNEKRVSNLVEDNINLRYELKEAMSEINRLEN